MTFKSIILFIVFLSFNLQAKLYVLVTTPDIAYMATRIGGSLVKVESLLDGSEDPHYVDAMPNFVAKAAKADIFCQVGMSLELGWAPRVLLRSGNKKIQRGGVGFCDTGSTVKAIEVPRGNIDRSMGDVHPEGNPHYHLGPTAFLQGAKTVMDVLITNDTKNAETYLKNYDILEKDVMKTKKYVQQLFRDLKNKNFLQYHREYSYFFKEYGLNDLGALEETPGIPPSAGRLARLAISMKNKKVNAVVATHNAPEKLLTRFKQMTSIPYLSVPLGIQSTKKGPKSFRQLQITIAKSILKGQ